MALNKALSLARTGPRGGARRYLLDLVRRRLPGAADARLLLAQVHLAAADVGTALEWIRAALRHDPHDARAHLWFGRILGMRAERGSRLRAPARLLQVSRAFEEAVRLDPGLLLARLDLFQYYLYAPEVLGGSLSRAYAQMEEIAQRDPGGALAAFARGLFRQEEGDLEAAQAAYQEGARRSRLHAPSALLATAYMLLAAGHPQASLRPLRRLLRRMPAGPIGIFDVLREDYFRVGGLEKARRAVEVEWRMDLPYRRAYDLLAQIYAREGMKDRADLYPRLPVEGGRARGR